MNRELREALDRTLLLMRDDISDEASDDDLLRALTGTNVVLAADARTLSTPAAQSTYITAAILMARSGHAVHLAAPDVPIAGPQPPLTGPTVVAGLLEVGRDLLPGVAFTSGLPEGHVDLCVTLGESTTRAQASHSVALNATCWAGYIEPSASASRWREPTWPMGALVAGALAAAEAFKISMRKLRAFARRHSNFDKQFALNNEARFALAPGETPKVANLGPLDFVSGGAITNSSIFCLLRLPQLRGSARVIENTSSDNSNLNRYMMQRRSHLSELKGETLQRFANPDFQITSVNLRLEASTFASLTPLAPRVLVGVDHIPTRWFVQESNPEWLAIGASTHWNVMASYHARGLACARCANPLDDDNDAPIPTVAFVSFWAGLLQIAYLLRQIGQGSIAASEQHIFFTPLRPEAPWRGGLLTKPDCPVCQSCLAA